MIDDAQLGAVRQLGSRLQLAGRGGLCNGHLLRRRVCPDRPGPADTEAQKELASTLKDLRRLIFQLLDLVCLLAAVL